MAVVVILTFAFLTCQVNSQIVGYGPGYPLPRGFEPTPCAPEACRSCQSIGVEPCLTIQQLPNIIPISQPISNIKTINQPCSTPTAILNLPAPSCQNQPVIKPVLQTQTVAGNPPPKCPNVQVTPICTKASPPSVVTVVDNTLANSLANALQLLLISNLLDNCGNNPPCEIAIPDFNVPSISCEYISKVVYPEPVFPCSEPIYPCHEVTPCPEVVFSCPETVYSCPEPIVSCQEPIVLQAYPTNYGYSVAESCQCAQKPIYLETPTQFVTNIAPSCNEPIPTVATISPMAMEIPFPASIPAQLICNFGLTPSNQPCVTFDVEPMPCGNAFV